MLTPSLASPASCQRLPARRNVAGDGVHVRGERVRLCGGRGLRPHRGRAGALCAALLAAAAGMHGAEAAQTWRGLAVAPEHRRTPYERGDNPYSQSVNAERRHQGLGRRTPDEVYAGSGSWPKAA